MLLNPRKSIFLSLLILIGLFVATNTYARCAITISKTAEPTSVPEPGGAVEFTIVVTNNSLEDATIDSLVDTELDLTTNCPDAVGTVLAGGASYTCIFTEFISGNAPGPDHKSTATVVASGAGCVRLRAKYQGVSLGFTEEGHPFIGEPDVALTIEERSDYLCPFCGRHFQGMLPALMDQSVPTVRVKRVFRDFPMVSLHPTVLLGHRAALCAGEQEAVPYWAMDDALFARQNEWNRLPGPSAFLAGVAGELVG